MGEGKFIPFQASFLNNEKSFHFCSNWIRFLPLRDCDCRLWKRWWFSGKLNFFVRCNASGWWCRRRKRQTQFWNKMKLEQTFIALPIHIFSRYSSWWIILFTLGSDFLQAGREITNKFNFQSSGMASASLDIIRDRLFQFEAGLNDKKEKDVGLTQLENSEVQREALHQYTLTFIYIHEKLELFGQLRRKSFCITASVISWQKNYL